jgi:hypothetical protein
VRKSRGNRAKAFEILKADVWDFVGKVKRNGEKRTKSEAEAMLRYRISRTLFDFAVQTGQHEVAKNRVQYGTGGTGQGVWKPAKRKAQKSVPRASRKKAAGGRARGIHAEGERRSEEHDEGQGRIAPQVVKRRRRGAAAVALFFD